MNGDKNWGIRDKLSSQFYVFSLIMLFGLVVISTAQDSLDISNLEMDTTFIPYAEYGEDTGDYFIYYFKDAKTGKMLRSMYVPPTKIDPKIDIKVYLLNEMYNYRYSVMNGINARQNIFSIDFKIKEKFQEMSFQEGWLYMNYLNEPFINIGHRGGYSDISPNDTLLFEVKSKYLPGVIDSRLLGKEERSSFSFLFSPPSEVYDIIDSLTTRVASDRGVKVKTVGPKFDPGSIENVAFLDTLSSYIDQSCDLEWIPAPGTCRSLAAMLEEARGLVAQKRPLPAREVLQALLDELEALPEAQLSPEARTLLYHNGKFLLGRLGEEQ